jgi:hypothetical protein
MKLTVFFDGYSPEHEIKDPGQIILGLQEIGIETELLTLSKKILTNYKPNFPMVQASWDELRDEQFWLKNDSDVVLAYTWLDYLYTPLLDRIKLSGKKVLIKSDSDGHIGYPLMPRDLRVPLFEELAHTPKLALRSATVRLWYRLPFGFLHSRKAMKRIRQIELSDGVIIESPDALSNINYFLNAWERRDLIKKTQFVPNPVAPDFIDSKIGNKEKIVVSMGRWYDIRQKNSAIMMKVIIEFLKNRSDYSSVILGVGTDIIRRLIRNAPKDVAERIRILGFVERRRVKEVLSNARIFFMPSRWEGLPIAACEAACVGCSIVGTPIESLRYLSMQGFSGTTAATFNRDAILASLIQDSIKWDCGYYEPGKMAAFWRAKLNRKSVARDLINLAKKLN